MNTETLNKANDLKKRMAQIDEDLQHIAIQESKGDNQYISLSHPNTSDYYGKVHISKKNYPELSEHVKLMRDITILAIKNVREQLEKELEEL